LSSRRTGLVTHRDCELHFAGPGHPESPERLAAILESFQASGLAAELDRRDAREAADEDLRLVHPEPYVRFVEDACRSGRRMLDAGDTYVVPESCRAARLAAGGLIDAVERVHAGEWSNAFVAVRPPGHHAEEASAMGFCLFANPAIAARHLRRRLGVERVAIVDWDVHHGNGTQHVLERDGSVFYASLHQYPHYPGTGSARERGLGEGEGATLNLPQPAGSGDREWLDAFERVLVPALDGFKPRFVLVSAGFDAHRDDPLSGTRVTEEGFRRMTELVLELANRHAGGRLVSVLEGGYDLRALARSAEAHVEELLRASRSAATAP
jgi:acetoin utilization deacetylase AcuC-like enzyme